MPSESASWATSTTLHHKASDHLAQHYSSHLMYNGCRPSMVSCWPWWIARNSISSIRGVTIWSVIRSFLVPVPDDDICILCKFSMVMVMVTIMTAPPLAPIEFVQTSHATIIEHLCRCGNDYRRILWAYGWEMFTIWWSISISFACNSLDNFALEAFRIRTTMPLLCHENTIRKDCARFCPANVS